MITDEELKISNQSYLNKDFYQIYPSLLDLVKQISERWDPASSNESDPGVVLLKLLAFLGDKINYNIDKNILECFMPSATQEESMRKLCSMMGYDMHYYRSAVTSVAFMWVGDELPESSDSSSQSAGSYIQLPRYETVVSNSTQDKSVKKVTYVLTESIKLMYKGQTVSATAIEGELVDFAINEDNIVRLSNLDDNRRLYFPEPQVAENGVFILSSDDAEPWDRVTNLNIHIATEQHPIWKFCFDSKKKLPFIQFPENIADIIGEGVKIKYIRSSGSNGNIPAKLLTALVSSTSVDYYDNASQTTSEIPISDGTNTYLVVQNPSFTQSGLDVETIDDAYEGFKKTIGTFDTLVTCRDYANAIYNMMVSDVDTAHLVSNVQVSDIRSDINFVNKIASFDDYGITYIDQPTTTTVQNNGSNQEVDDIDHFDIYIYPLNPVRSLYIAKNYQETFKPNANNVYAIRTNLDEYKTISHNIKQISLAGSSISDKNLYLIKNYYHLSAKISTTTKVSKAEGDQILNNVSVALYENFNPRKLDYGEEIPYESLLKVIQNADPRIKFVSLNEPEITTKLMFGNGQETDLYASSNQNIRNYLVAKNVLAGRLPLFNYDRRFDFSFGQTNASSNQNIYGAIRNYPSSMPTPSTDMSGYSITALSTSLSIPVSRLNGEYTLRENESIQLKARNISTELTYPIGVNYFFTKADHGAVAADTDYKFVLGDALYINYTDSDNNIHNIKYWFDGSKGHQQETNGADLEWSGIIRCNFNLLDSESNTATYSKSSGFNFTDSLPGMYQLSGSSQIELRKYVKSKITSSTFLCYWSTNNSNILTFKNVPSAQSGDMYTFEYTLNNNEYFFYTDALKNSLVTLGSGTTLTLKKQFSNTAPATLSWTLPSSSEMDIDDVATKGIGAFADTDWHIEHFEDGRQEFYVEENRLIILNKDDKIKLTGTLPGSPSTITGQWQSLEGVELTYNGKPLPKSENLGTDGVWYVRAMLNLNIGSYANFKLGEDTDSNPVVQKVALYTSVWEDNGVVQAVDDTTDLSKLTEEILVDYPVAEFDNTSTVYLKANYNIQEGGGELLSMHRYSYAGVLQDDLYVYPYVQSKCTIGSDELPLNTFADNFTKATINNAKSVTLPTYIPSNSFGVFMIYYLKPANEDNTTYLTLNSYQPGAATPVAAINFYQESASQSYAPGISCQLRPGINVFRVDSGCDLVIDTSHAGSGSMIFSDIDIVRKADGHDITGINSALLNLPQTSSAKVDFLNKLLSIDTDLKFYYNIPINNYSQVDVAEMDEYSWFNHNNVCNKFVLAEIDTDLDDIQIAKSSRSGQW